MSTMKPLISILFLLLRLSASHAQTSIPTPNPSPAPTFSKLRPTTEPAPVFTPSPTDAECANYPGWFYEYLDYSPNCDSSWNYKTLKLGCDDDRVGCDDYGRFGAAEYSCCKCKWQCEGQCDDPISAAPTPDDDCYQDYTYDYDDYYDEDDGFITTSTIVAICICCCLSCCLRSCNQERQLDASLEANRQTMATRRQEQRQSNSQGLTDEERNHARYELFVTKFHFQTVLQDKSNISASSLRTSATKPNEDHPNEDKHNDDDEASAIGRAERPLKSTLSRRLSSWRRPSAKDECCICLECYNVGETICAAITKECDHVFHEGCILQWLKNNDKCPLCRVELLKESDTQA